LYLFSLFFNEEEEMAKSQLFCEPSIGSEMVHPVMDAPTYGGVPVEQLLLSPVPSIGSEQAYRNDNMLYAVVVPESPHVEHGDDDERV
jgi:hypothetical protein